MEFKKATDDLFDGVSHQDLAKILGVSVASVRQARLQQGAKARRSPPGNWEKAVVELASNQMDRYRRLISELSAQSQRTMFDEPPASGSRKKT